MTSWQTAASGILAFVVALATALMYQLDGNPETEPNWNLVVVALITMIGFLRARDSSVSDEESGIPPRRTSQQAYARAIGRPVGNIPEDD